MTTRRAILTTGMIASAAVILPVGYAWAPGTAGARAPWRQAGGSFGDPRLDALSYAILAPNPHNRQPWRFTLDPENGVTVYCDLSKRLPNTDPFDRQITVGFGCMLELLRQAATAKKHRIAVASFPDGAPGERLDERPIAKIQFFRDDNIAEDPLFTAIPTRRSNKTPYDLTRKISKAQWRDIEQQAGRPFMSPTSDIETGAAVDGPMVDKIRAIAGRAWSVEYELERTRMESIEVMRIGNRAVDANPDGISLNGIPIGLLHLAGMVTPKKLNTPGTIAYTTGFDGYNDLITNTPGFIWIKSNDDDRTAQLDAGAMWARLNLAAEKTGLCVHPISQALQEFPEMADPYRDIHSTLGEPFTADGQTIGRVVQMLGRIGYAPTTPPAPRHPLTSVLNNA